MTFHPPSTPDDRDDPAEAMAARHSRMLAELADIAMQLARAAGRKALAQAEVIETEADRLGEADQGDFGRAFAGMARCVRQTLALQAKLARADRARADAGRVHPFADRGALEVVRERLRRKLEAWEDEDLDDGAALDPREPGDREDLLADLHERLDDDDTAGRDGAATGEAVARIRRDLERLSDPGGAPAAATPPPPSPDEPRPDPPPRGAPAGFEPPPPGRAHQPP